MRLPRYARGLQLVRFGVLAMLLQLLLGIALLVNSLSVITMDDAMTVVDYTKYVQWANMAAVGAMLVGTLLAVPDFLAARMSLARVAMAALGFAIALAALIWSYRALMRYVDMALAPTDSLDELSAATRGLELMPLVAVVKDVAYTIGLLALVSSIRQTAVANDHDGLRATAAYVSKLLGVMLVGDVGYQWMYGIGSAGGVTSVMLGVGIGLGVLGYWVYCHLKLAKFLRAAAMLVHEPHNLPSAKIVSGAETAPAQRAIPKPPPTPRAPRAPSAPVITVAAELRVAPTPRAETAPGDPTPEGPKFLK